MKEILALSSSYKFRSVLWEGTTVSFFKALDSFLSFFFFLPIFFSLRNVNSLGRLIIVINKSHIFRPNTDYIYIYTTCRYHSRIAQGIFSVLSIR